MAREPLAYERAIVLDTQNHWFQDMAIGPAFHFGQRVRYPSTHGWMRPALVVGMQYHPDDGWLYLISETVVWFEEGALEAVEDSDV